MKIKKLVTAFFVLAFIMFFLVFGIYYIIAKTVVDAVGDEKSKYTEIVGEQVILKGDTLMITDYSILENDLMLENGQSISYELGKKLLLTE